MVPCLFESDQASDTNNLGILTVHQANKKCTTTSSIRKRDVTLVRFKIIQTSTIRMKMKRTVVMRWLLISHVNAAGLTYSDACFHTADKKVIIQIM